MVMTTASNPKLLWPGVYDVFQKAAVDFPLIGNRIFESRTSRQAFEDIVELTSMGLAVVKDQGQGSNHYEDIVQGDIARFVPLVYENGFQVTEEEIEDCLYAQVGTTRAKELRRSMEKTREYVLSQVLNRAADGNYVGPDGVSLLNVAHPYTTGLTFSNMFAVATPLSEASIEDAVIGLQEITTDQGLPAQINPRRLIVHRNEQFNVQRYLHTDYKTESDFNDINVLKAQGTIPEIVVWQYLTIPAAWFIQTDAPEGFLTFERRGITLRQDSDFETGNAKHKASMRFSAGYANAQCVYGNGS